MGMEMEKDVRDGWVSFYCCMVWGGEWIEVGLNP